MTDIKDVFAQLLAAPAPPMVAAEHLLATAHAAAGRRRALRSGVATLATAGAVAVTLAAAPVVMGQSAPGPDGPAGSVSPSLPLPSPSRFDPGPTPSPSGAGSVGCTGTAPPRSEPCLVRSGPALDRAAQLLAVLQAQAQATVSTRAAEQPFGAVRYPNGLVVSHARVVVGSDSSPGHLTGQLHTGGPAGGSSEGDLCARPVPAPEDGCRVVVTGGGTRIRLSWVEQDGHRSYTAMRYYRGATVVIGHWSPVGPLYTQRQLAELAARPEFGPRA